MASYIVHHSKYGLNNFVFETSLYAEALMSIYLMLLPQFVPTALTLDSGITRPPPLLSEADLLNCMDKVENSTT